jgi:putative phage-type endonuclease
LVLVQGSPQWLERRRKGIGSGEIGTLMGLRTFEQTPYSIFLDKFGLAPIFQGNYATRHGQKYEPVARRRYEKLTGELMPATFAVHSHFLMCFASLDGYHWPQKKILEIKCPIGKAVVSAALLGRVAAHYIPQVYYQLAVTGADALTFLVYHHNRKIFQTVKVRPNLEYQRQLILTASEFWNKHVLTGTPPPLEPDDIKLVMNPLVKEICLEIEERHPVLPRHKLDFMKERVIRIGGHQHVRCGNVQITTVIRKGNFHFHKLTINNRGEQNGAA